MLAVQLAHRAIQAGELGEIVHVTRRFGGEANPGENPYRNLFETQCHGFDMLEHLAGPISSVMAQMSNLTDAAAYHTMAIAVRFANRGVGSLLGSYDTSYAYPDTQYIEVNGTRGRAVIRDTVQELILSTAGDETHRVWRPGYFNDTDRTFTHTFDRYVDAVLAALRAGEPPPIHASAGRRAAGARHRCAPLSRASVSRPDRAGVTRGPASIRDVAELAGVSPGTASKALNQRGSLRPETIERVLAASEELGYRPNELVRGIFGRRSFTVGLITTDSFGRFSGPVMAGAEDALGSGELSVIMCDSRGDPDRERRHLTTLLGRRIDGLIVTGRCSNPRPPIASSLPFPVVYAHTPSTDPRDCSVMVDDEGAGRLAARHLIEVGRRGVGHITGPPDFDACIHDPTALSAPVPQWHRAGR